MNFHISRAKAAELIVLIETGLHRLEGLQVYRKSTDEWMWLDESHDAVSPIADVSSSLQELFGMTFNEAEELAEDAE